jgi:hypothetical protein
LAGHVVDGTGSLTHHDRTLGACGEQTEPELAEEAGLPDAAGPDERDQAMAAERRQQLGDQ